MMLLRTVSKYWLRIQHPIKTSPDSQRGASPNRENRKCLVLRLWHSFKAKGAPFWGVGFLGMLGRVRPRY